MIKVIIAGTRDFDNYELLKQKMDKILAGKVRNNEEGKNYNFKTILDNS